MTEVELRELLRLHRVDTRLYGRGKFKTIAQLLAEITHGESTLTVVNEQLLRKIAVVELDISVCVAGRYFRLIEKKQVLSDGRVRLHTLRAAVNEKLMPGESTLVAIERALSEELGLSNTLNEWTISLPKTCVERKQSPSYPNLKAEFTFHRFQLVMPLTFYREDGYKEVQGDKVTYFEWEPIIPT